jgi:hypothetical protein
VAIPGRCAAAPNESRDVMQQLKSAGFLREDKDGSLAQCAR